MNEIICDPQESRPHRLVAFWRTRRVTCIVLIADDDSGILDPGPRVQAKPTNANRAPLQ